MWALQSPPRVGQHMPCEQGHGREDRASGRALGKTVVYKGALGPYLERLTFGEISPK